MERHGYGFVIPAKPMASSPSALHFAPLLSVTARVRQARQWSDAESSDTTMEPSSPYPIQRPGRRNPSRGCSCRD